MDILIFDMDGVLLEARGYHRALQETVRLAGEHLSLGNIQLTEEQIHKFESVGISSEWHSSALCLAVLEIQILSGVNSPSMKLDELFSTLQNQSLDVPAIERCQAAIQLLCKRYQVNENLVVPAITDAADIDRSLTMQWFQELVLGTDSYQTQYNKNGGFNTQSYLKLFDIPLISPEFAEVINTWHKNNNGRAAIMTNRPSGGPGDFSGSPEAELGLELVHLPMIPLVGFGEISWLAKSIKVDPGTLVKPNTTHALSAILRSANIEKELSLRTSLLNTGQWPKEILENLHGATITVFEDTPAGLVSVSNAGKVLRQAGIDVEIRSIGIANDTIKKAALEAQGAEVLMDINSALERIENLGSFTGN